MLFFLRTRQTPRSTLFPYTTLFRSDLSRGGRCRAHARARVRQLRRPGGRPALRLRARARGRLRRRRDRKSTRLNSSHLGISYAVFCLKKKKNTHKHELTKEHE